MSQSRLTNDALEVRNTNTDSTKCKVLFEPNKAVFSGLNSGTKVNLEGIADPVNSADCATKNYVDNAISGLDFGIAWKDSVKCRTTANLPAVYATQGTLEAFTEGSSSSLSATFDSVNLSAGDRVLVMMQDDPTQNGIYKMSNVGADDQKWSLDRTDDANSLSGSGDIRRASTFVEQGHLYSGRGYVQSADIQTLNQDPVEFHLMATISEVSALDGLKMSGKNIMVNTDSNRAVAIMSDKVGIIDKGITTQLLADDAVDTLQLKDNCIIPSKLQAGCINNADKFTSGVVDTDTLATGSVTAVKLATNSVEASKIKNQNVTRDKIADDAIDATKITPAGIENESLADSCVTSTKIGSGQVTTIHYAVGSVTGNAIGAGAVGTTQLASNSVTTSKIKSQNITTALLNQTVGSEAVSTETLRDDCITNDKIADDSVSETQLQAECVSESKLADGCVSQRTLGVLNTLQINGPVQASAFIAGGSSAGQSTMGLARAVQCNVSFDNNSWSMTTEFTKIPNDDACLSFTYNDNISCVHTSYFVPFITQGEVNGVQVRIRVLYFKEDGSEMIDEGGHPSYIDWIGFSTEQNRTYYPIGTHGLAVKESTLFNGGTVDRRIAKIYVEAKKDDVGSVVIPQTADFNLIGIVIADDSVSNKLIY